MVFKLAFTIVLSSLSSLAIAQGAEGRGSLPPGSSADGSRPMDGAIKGGSILPGESGGIPDMGRRANPDVGIKRCEDLSGTLREDCLRQEASASGGASLPERGRDVPGPARTTPPPQNPR